MMAKMREELAKQLRENRQSWFKAWFKSSPWFTTLISATMGLLAIFLLLLTFGPYILNCLLAFTREHVSIVQITMLRQQYQELNLDEV